MNKFEEKWQTNQIYRWKRDKRKIVDFFLRFGLDINALYDHITKLDYNRMQIIRYLLSKNEKAIKICDFLDELEQNSHEDTDAIKIFFLVCHAEIAMSNFGVSGSKIDLVKNFFKIVEKKYGLNYKVRASLGSGKEGESYALILSMVRNEYAHTGEYTGKIFRDPSSDNDSYNVFALKDRGQYIGAECGLTYYEFVNIYIRPFAK